MNKPMKMTFGGLGLFATLAILLAIVAGCKDNGGDPPPATNPVDLRSYMPLKAGNVWHYMTINYSESAPPDTTIDSVGVGDTTTYNGKLCRTMTGTAVAFPIANLVWMSSVDASDYSIYACISCLSSKQFAREPFNQTGWSTYHILKSPATKGSRWLVNDLDSAAGYFTVQTADSTVSTRAGSFSHCFVVQREMTGATGDLVLVLAPGVGVIKRSYSHGFGGDAVELIDHTLH